MEKTLARSTEEGSRQLVWAAVGGANKLDDLRGAYISLAAVDEASDYVISQEGQWAQRKLWVIVAFSSRSYISLAYGFSLTGSSRGRVNQDRAKGARNRTESSIHPIINISGHPMLNSASPLPFFQCNWLACMLYRLIGRLVVNFCCTPGYRIL